MNKKLLLLIPTLLGLLLSSCNNSGTGANDSIDNSSSSTTDNNGDSGDGSSDGNSDSDEDQTGGDDSDEQNTKSEFNDAVFASATYTYDGNSHILAEVSGIPEGTTVTYTNRKEYTDVGSYQASAKLVKDGYNDKTINATLTITPATFNDITFENQDFIYDGQPHSISIDGTLPSTASVIYSSNVSGITNEATDIGEYLITAKITDKNFNDLVLNATLTINRASFSGISFTDREFEYDGQPHSITITGTLPSTASVSYSSNVSGITNEATDIGEYLITAKITDKNFNDLELTATLTIKTNDDERYLKWSDDTLFFQNALHDNYLYAYNSTDSKLLKVSNDNAFDIISTGNDKVIYVSKTLVASSVKSAKYVTSSSSVARDTLFSENARYIQYGSDTVIYYVINGLTNSKSGIYKVDLSGDEPVSTCLSVGKAKYLTLVNNTLYFADGSNGYKLSSLSLGSSNLSRTLVVDEKINNLYCYNGSLYYTVNNLLGNYIEKFALSSQTRVKLTSDAGIDFSFINGYLYYINVDKLNTMIWGKGIYKVNALSSSDNSQPGSKVIEAERGICSLTDDGTYLYYYDMDGYKLNKADTSGDIKENILDNFVKPDDPTPHSFGGDMGEYNGVLYYLNIWDDKTLHSYNPTTKVDIRLTSNKVDNFSIIGDEIYMNMVTNLTNNDTYRFNLKTGSEIEKFDKYDGSDFVSDGTYLYYACANAVGVKTEIRRTHLTTFESEQIYSKGVSNLRLINGKLYFIDGYQIYSMDVSSKATTEIKPNNDSVHTTAFDSDGTSIYYRDMYGLAYSSKQLSKFNLETNEKSIIVKEKTDPISIVCHDDDVYYYTDTLSGNNGLYRAKANTSSSTTGTSVLTTEGGYYATTFTLINNSIYFTNYKTGGTFGDSHIYEVPVSGGTPVKIA